MATTGSNWSKEHESVLEAAEKKLEGNWVTENAKDAEDDTQELLRKAFRNAFYSGAGCSHKVREMGIS